MMRDLLSDPLWREEDLGSPLPPTPYGVSVCLPLWRHVIGYEEKDPAVVSQFRSGYPRFCCPPAIGALFEAAEGELAGEGERCLVFPRVVHAERCVAFIRRMVGEDVGRVQRWRTEGFGVAVFPGGCYDVGRRFWRFCGEVVSTRQAVAALTGAWVGCTPESGHAASALICERLAGLYGQQAEDVFLFPSGMAANYAVHRMLVSLCPGFKTLQLDFPYVDVLKLQQAFGAGAHFLPLLREEDYRDQLGPLLREERLAGVFAEAPSNPLLRCVDFRLVRELMDQAPEGLPLVVDDTVATVVNVDVMRYADVVTTSLTKAFSGVGDVMAGSVVLKRESPFYAYFAAFLRREADHELWYGDAVELERNSRDFVERVRRAGESSRRLCDWLDGRPEVERVWDVWRCGGEGFDAIRRSDGTGSGLFSMVLRERARTPAFYDALRVSKGPSLGTHFTLACPYTLLAHYDELEWAASCGVDRDLVRVSVGLESCDELIARFAEALKKI